MFRNKNKDSYVLEDHPFGTFVNPDTEYLIIGTFPTHERNRVNTYEFFYSGEENLFWPVIENVFNHQFRFQQGEAAKEERQTFLTKKLIGITDMHETCYRKNGLSTDEHLIPVVLTDIFHLLDEFGSIRRLILTSRFDVFSALALFRAYFLQKRMDLGTIDKTHDKILRGKFMHKGRKIEVLVPYSPSPRLIKQNIVTLPDLIHMYDLCLNW